MSIPTHFSTLKDAKEEDVEGSQEFLQMVTIGVKKEQLKEERCQNPIMTVKQTLLLSCRPFVLMLLLYLQLSLLQCSLFAIGPNKDERVKGGAINNLP